MLLYSRHKYPKNRRGVSLIELMVVLGISSLMVAGSLTWFESRKRTDFSNEMRQIESQIRLAQSQIAGNELPGFNAACQNASRLSSVPGEPDCPVGQNEQVFATMVQMSTTPPDDKRLTTSYVSAATSATTRMILASGIKVYATVPRDSIEEVKYVGYRVAPSPCAESYDEWRSTDNLMGAPADATDDENIIAFRRDPNVFNHLTGAISDYSSWGGDDPSVILNSGGTVSSMPCAVMWSFESEEQINNFPRFTADIVFDIRNRSIKLQTR